LAIVFFVFTASDYIIGYQWCNQIP
jgi:hypothetical protein